MLRLIGFTFLLVLLGFGIYGYIQRAELVENYLSKKFNSEVHLSDVTIGLSNITLHNLKIKNKPEALLRYKIRAKALTITLKPWAFLHRTVAIDSIKIEQATMPLELLAASLFNKEAPEKYTLKTIEISHLRLTSPLKKELPEIPYLKIDLDSQPLNLAKLSTYVFAAIDEQIENPAHIANLPEEEETLLDKGKATLKKYLSPLFNNLQKSEKGIR